MERKEAIEVIKKNWPDSSFTMLREALETLIPELKESEDERMIKSMTRLVKAFYDVNFPTPEGFTKEDMLAWLEQKGEQNPAFEMKTPEESLGIDSDTYNKIVDECIYGDDKSTWSKEDEERLQSCLNILQAKGFMGATDTINTKWLKSLKDKTIPQPKQEWSEEDEQYLLVCKNALAKYQVSDKWDATIILQWLENKLKALRPQNTWKPSEEQLDALNDVISSRDIKYDVLSELWKNLKKLKE